MGMVRKVPGILVQNRQAVRAMHKLELIRHTERIGSGQRHTVGGSARVLSRTHYFVFFGSGFQGGSGRQSAGVGCRSRSGGSTAASSAASATATEIVDSGKIRLAVCKPRYFLLGCLTGGGVIRGCPRDIHGN